MSDEPDRDRWLAIASAIAEGREIAWDDETSQTEGDRELVGALRALQAIADAQRRIHESPSTELTRWAHLAIIEKAGAGSGWARYRARDPGLARDVMLHVAGPLAGEPASVERLLRHARAQAQLHHPNVATAYGADYAQDLVGVWTESTTGPTLEQLVRQNGPLQPGEAATLVVDLCAGVDVFHRAGLVHGHVAPENITRSADGRPVLGASVVAALPASERDVPPRETDLYLAPESPRGAVPGNAVDILGVGITLHYVLTGRYPATADESGHPAGASATAIPRPLSRIVKRALSEDPAHRFASAGELADALRRAGRGGGPGREWILGFAIAALLAALALWLAARAAA